MTSPSRTPSWDEIEQFCRIDGWERGRSTEHEFWRLVLPSGEVLETHTSYAGNKTMSQGRFASILRNQLKVSRGEFWKALQTGEAVDRPSEEEDSIPGHDAWVVIGLKGTGMSEAEIAELSPDDARSLLYRKWSEPE